VEEQLGGVNTPVLRGSAPQPAVACLARAGSPQSQISTRRRCWTCGGVGH
jgi:hypothetical protein